MVGGLATAAALPFLARVRTIGGPADRIRETAAGVEATCAASELPAVSAVETQVAQTAAPSLR